MKSLGILLLLLGLSLFFNSAVHAEGNCPEGYYPIGGDPSTGAPQGCAPIPGYGQGQQQGGRPSVPEIQWVDRWGAIASDAKQGSIGVANDVTTKDNAESAALADCRSRGGANCKVDTRFRNACGVVIAGDTSFNVWSAPTTGEAVKVAMKTCTDSGTTHCHVYYSACSSAQRVR